MAMESGLRAEERKIRNQQGAAEPVIVIKEYTSMAIDDMAMDEKLSCLLRNFSKRQEAQIIESSVYRYFSYVKFC